jgi:RimJ/RimL family protein N-acetyltransferase
VIGSEVVRHLVAYLFENTPAHNVSGWVSSWNEAGLAFAKAEGFSESGRIPRFGIRDGAYYEAVIVDLLKTEWRESERGRHGA